MNVPGSLTKEQVLKLANAPGSVFYRVNNENNKIWKVCVVKFDGNMIWSSIPTGKGRETNTDLPLWFDIDGRPTKRGYIFDSYFHALAYSLKQKRRRK